MFIWSLMYPLGCTQVHFGRSLLDDHRHVRPTPPCDSPPPTAPPVPQRAAQVESHHRKKSDRPSGASLPHKTRLQSKHSRFRLKLRQKGYISRVMRLSESESITCEGTPTYICAQREVWSTG